MVNTTSTIVVTFMWHYVVELCFCSMPCPSLLHSFFIVLVIGPCEGNKDKNGPLGVKKKNQQWHT
jgi:hypothetical protein